jgi:RNA polymerase-binding transcription factor DksA
VEIKVREIVKKTRSKTPRSEEKKESFTFNLDDVRAIIQKRKAVAVSSKPKKKKKVKEKEEKLFPSNEEPKKSGKSVKVKKLQTASIDDILGFGVSVGPTRPIRDAKKVPKEWKVYYIDLMNLRHSLKGALGQRSNETLGASARESSGELSINSADSGSESFNRDVALSMVATEQEALEEIEDAIDRIFDGTFGICQETEKPIKKSRLKVVPFTRFSLEGQTLYEKRNRKERDTGGGIFATISDSTLGDDS